MKVIDFVNMGNGDYFKFVLLDSQNGRKYTNIKKYEDCEVRGIFPTFHVSKDIINTRAYPKIGLWVYHDDILRCKGK